MKKEQAKCFVIIVLLKYHTHVLFMNTTPAQIHCLIALYIHIHKCIKVFSSDETGHMFIQVPYKLHLCIYIDFISRGNIFNNKVNLSYGPQTITIATQHTRKY